MMAKHTFGMAKGFMMYRTVFGSELKVENWMWCALVLYFCPDSALNYWFSYGFWECWRIAAVTYCYWLYCFAVLLVVIMLYGWYITPTYLQLCTFNIDVFFLVYVMVAAQQQFGRNTVCLCNIIVTLLIFNLLPVVRYSYIAIFYPTKHYTYIHDR